MDSLNSVLDVSGSTSIHPVASIYLVSSCLDAFWLSMDEQCGSFIDSGISESERLDVFTKKRIPRTCLKIAFPLMLLLSGPCCVYATTFSYDAQSLLERERYFHMKLVSSIFYTLLRSRTCRQMVPPSLLRGIMSSVSYRCAHRMQLELDFRTHSDISFALTNTVAVGMAVLYTLIGEENPEDPWNFVVCLIEKHEISRIILFFSFASDIVIL